MRKKYETLKDQYPEYISLGQLCQICRIAKRSALYLVQHGVIPAIDTGKRTWRYKIVIDDVIIYLRRREQKGSMIPLGAVSSRPARPKNRRVSFSTLIRPGSEDEGYRYFEQLYENCGDVLTAPDIIAMTGLSHKTVLQLLKDGEIKSIGSSPRYIVPKTYLLEFVTSPRYINTLSNSDKFKEIVKGFETWKTTGSIK